MDLAKLRGGIRRGLRAASRIYWKLTREEVLVLGDSHAAVFGHGAFRSSFPRYWFNVVSVGGATVSGLENPNSKTQALPIFRQHLRSSRAKTIIVLLGEVDTGFVIWYRAEKYRTDVSKMLSVALSNYQGLILELSKVARVLCVSAPLPTIRDGEKWGEVANARASVTATQMQRTELTIDFNRQMREFCQRSGVSYLSLDEVSIGADGLVDRRLLNVDAADHHYEKSTYAKLIISGMAEYF